jgi:cyclic pyranopterin phosphate synthase
MPEIYVYLPEILLSNLANAGYKTLTMTAPRTREARTADRPPPYSGCVASAFTHLDDRGSAHMVDVTAKAPTRRRAEARCRVDLAPEALSELSGTGPAAAVLDAAQVAGVLAAKRTSTLIPLCHPLPLGTVAVSTSIEGGAVVVVAVVEAFAQTGVEMEALTACTVAALTVYHAHRHTEPKPVLEDVCVWEKSGGRSGAWGRGGPRPAPPGTTAEPV